MVMLLMITYGPWQRVIGIALVKVMCYPTENDNAVPAACDFDTLGKA